MLIRETTIKGIHGYDMKTWEKNPETRRRMFSNMTW